MIYAIDETIRTNLRNALLSPDLHIGEGVGSVDGERCTIAEINLVLTGILTDRAHPCISEVIRRWVIGVQDNMPNEMRNSVAWREAAVGIAGSAASEEVEQQRVALILDWMWEALADETVLATVPESVRSAWDTMLMERTYDAARAAYAYASAAYYAARAAAAACATARAAAAGDAYAAAAACATARAAACATARATARAAAGAAVNAARAAHAVARANDAAAYWERRNPTKLLAELIEVR